MNVWHLLLPYAFIFFKSNQISLHSWVGKRISFMKGKKKKKAERVATESQKLLRRNSKATISQADISSLHLRARLQRSSLRHVFKTRLSHSPSVRGTVIVSAESLVYVNLSTSAVNQTESNWRAEAVSPSWVCLHCLSQRPMLNWYRNV